MANISDGEDSQMHDSPSSTPSTPPLSHPHLVNTAEHLSLHSPPESQKTPPASQQGTPIGDIIGAHRPHAHLGPIAGSIGAVGPPGGKEGLVPSWATKRAVEDAETAREKLVDGKFNLRWVGDDYDESDMFKTN